MRLSELGEFGLVRLLTSRFPTGPDVLLGAGDDAAVLDHAGPVLVSVDLLVQDRHFRLDWSSATEIGRKAVAENLSDINAMGGRPTALALQQLFPDEFPEPCIDELPADFRREGRNCRSLEDSSNDGAPLGDGSLRRRQPTARPRDREDVGVRRMELNGQLRDRVERSSVRPDKRQFDRFGAAHQPRFPDLPSPISEGR